MTIVTKVVWDIESMEIIERVTEQYSGPWERLKPSRSPLEGQANATSQQDQASATANENTAQGTLSQFEGPVQDSPYYKALVSSGEDATSQAYQNAEEATRANANQAGFGYEQPVTQGAESAVQAQEASQLGQLPTQAMEAAAPLSMQAAGQTAGIGESQGQQGLGYFGDATSLEEQYQQMNQSFLNQLEGAGLGGLAGGISGEAGDIISGANENWGMF